MSDNDNFTVSLPAKYRPLLMSAAVDRGIAVTRPSLAVQTLLDEALAVKRPQMMGKNKAAAKP